MPGFAFLPWASIHINSACPHVHSCSCMYMYCLRLYCYPSALTLCMLSLISGVMRVRLCTLIGLMLVLCVLSVQRCARWMQPASKLHAIWVALASTSVQLGAEDAASVVAEWCQVQSNCVTPYLPHANDRLCNHNEKQSKLQTCKPPEEYNHT